MSVDCSDVALKTSISFSAKPFGVGRVVLFPGAGRGGALPRSWQRVLPPSILYSLLKGRMRHISGTGAPVAKLSPCGHELGEDSILVGQPWWWVRGEGLLSQESFKEE